MKKRNKLALGTIALAAVALFASGCTANFSTSTDKSRIAYAFEPGVSEFIIGDTTDTTNVVYNEEVESFSNIHQVVRATGEGTNLEYSKSKQLNTILKSARSSHVAVPEKEYFVKLDSFMFLQAVNEYNADHADAVIDFSTLTADKQSLLDDCLKDYGYRRFYADDNAFKAIKNFNESARQQYGYQDNRVCTVDFENFYISQLETLVNQYRSCITVYDEVEYGAYGENKKTSVKLDKVTWKQAWGKGGRLIEGLIVYPVAWLIDAFAILFAGGKSAGAAAIQKQYATGVPQLLSIVVVTVIVRLFIFLCTFKSTLAQKKMSELQPELAKIQQKYPNANTNQAQKQRLAEEQMRLYKKHKVNPLSQLLVLIIQFPVFIGVWGAMTGSAVLSTGKFLGLHLSDSIWATLKMGPKQTVGWWTALVLILIMSAAQFFSMKVPQWIQKAKTNKVAKLGKNPAQKQQNRTANIVSYVMLIMIIIMGFTLPAAMGVYWFVGAIVSLIQTVLTTVVFAGNKKKK